MAWRFKKEATSQPPQQPTTKSGPRNYAPVIIEAAKRHGIDPKVALRVARHEGGLRGYVRALGKKGGKREPAWGPFQLLVGGGDTGYPEGMGNQMIRETGLDPRDEKNAEAAIDFAMKQASQHGWGQWYGARAAGLSNRAGIGGAPVSNMAASVGRAHGAGGASLGVGVGGSNIEGGSAGNADNVDFASLEPNALEIMTGSEGIPEVDPLDEEEQTLADALGQGSEFSLDFEGADETAAGGLERGAALKDEILAMIANGIEAQTSSAVLPRLPGFPQIG